MDRRSALKYLGVASAAAVLLPSCVADRKKLTVALNNLQITTDDQDLLGAIAEALIPATDSPGAKELEAHLHTFVMVDDCRPGADQEAFLTGMRKFEAEVKSLTGKSFMKEDVQSRSALLASVEEKKDALSEDVAKFYRISRGYIIQGYTTSQHFLKDIKPYVHIPGPKFVGCKSLYDQTNPLS
jgi:hypothetical protein